MALYVLRFASTPGIELYHHSSGGPRGEGTQATENLVRRLGINGFRFDAPTYNELPNWSKATEKRASYSLLGCLDLFDRLRPRQRALKDESLRSAFICSAFL